MARLRLTIGGAIPVDPIRPPVVMGGSFAVAATASLTSGLGRAALAIGGSITAYAAQALLGTLAVSAGARLLANLSGAFVVSGTASGAVAPSTWPNGYLYRRRIVLAAQPDLAAETVTDFPAFIDSTEVPGDWSWLVTAAGKLLSVVGSTPRDIRFTLEDGATKLDHHVEQFDGTAGTLRAFVRVPSWACASADFRFFVYYGKSGQADEQNVAGTWQGASLVVDTTTGSDLTGKGHTFARSGAGLTNTTLDGRPAALFAATGNLRRTNADLTFLDGVASWTEEFWAKVPSAADGGISRLGGAPGSSAPSSRFTTWAELSGSVGADASANVLEVGAGRWDGVATQTNQSTESVAAAADGTTVRHLMVVREAGQANKLYDGETDLSSALTSGTVTGGTLHPRSDDNYSLGANTATGTPAAAAAMTLGLYAVWPSAFSATRRGLADRLQRDGSLVACLGGVDLVGDTNHGPAGVAFRRAVTAQATISMQGHAYDPDAGATITATAVTPASDSSATYAIVAGALRVTPVAGVTGVGRPVVTVSDGTKTSKVSPRLAISSGSVGRWPSGLAWASGMNPTGSQVGANTVGTQLDEWGTWRGRPCDIWNSKFNSTNQGTALSSLQQKQQIYADCYSRGIAVEQVFDPYTDELPITTAGFQAFANGNFDTNINACLRVLNSYPRRPGFVIRLFHETDSSTNGSVDKDPTADKHLWWNAFAHAATLVRNFAWTAANGPAPLIDLNFIRDSAAAGNKLGGLGLNALIRDFTLVDIISPDYYCNFNHAVVPSAAAWDTLSAATGGSADKPKGLASWFAYARSKGKKASIPEWGVSTGFGAGAAALGTYDRDYPWFIDGVWRDLRANSDIVQYDAYFEGVDGVKDHNLDTGAGTINHTSPFRSPLCSAKYKALWKP